MGPTLKSPFKPKLYADMFWNSFGSSIFDEQTEFIGDPNGEPFVVTVRGGHWIPVSVLVFAASEEDAKERITNGIRRIIEKRRAIMESKRGDRHADEYTGDLTRTEKILELIDQGNMYTEPFDKRCLTRAVWACNDDLA